jgi:hypothetical protein
MAAKKYADDYENVIMTDEKGQERKKAVYRGEYYEVALDARQIKTFRNQSLALAIAILILHVVGGFIGNLGMYEFYVSLPYVFAFLPLYFIFSGAFRIPKEQRKYHRDEISLSYNHMKNAGTALLILLLIAVVGEGVFILLSEQTLEGGMEYIFLSLEGVAAGLAFLFFRLQKRVTPVKGSSVEENSLPSIRE